MRICACSSVTDMAVRSLALLQLITLAQSRVLHSCTDKERDILEIWREGEGGRDKEICSHLLTEGEDVGILSFPCMNLSPQLFQK